MVYRMKLNMNRFVNEVRDRINVLSHSYLLTPLWFVHIVGDRVYMSHLDIPCGAGAGLPFGESLLWVCSGLSRPNLAHPSMWLLRLLSPRAVAKVDASSLLLLQCLCSFAEASITTLLILYALTVPHRRKYDPVGLLAGLLHLLGSQQRTVSVCLFRWVDNGSLSLILVCL